MALNSPAPSYDDLVRALAFIEHATAPTHEDGAHHEAAHEIASGILAQVRAANAQPALALPQELHPATAELVVRFAQALADKLMASQRKYGYSDNWARPDWMDLCRTQLLEHVAKGDPRDVAAYCAFLWHHGQRTADATQAPASASWPLPRTQHPGIDTVRDTRAADESTSHARASLRPDFRAEAVCRFGEVDARAEFTCSADSLSEAVAYFEHKTRGTAFGLVKVEQLREPA
jgi:hypothetical protein